MTRLVVKDKPFEAIFYSGGEEHQDLLLNVLDSAFRIVGTVAPTQFESLIGAYHAQVTLSTAATFYLKWTYTGGEHIDQVVVLDSMPATSTFSVGSNQQMVLASDVSGATAGLRVFGPDFSELVASPYAATEREPGFYVSDAVALENAGAYLLVWLLNGVFHSYTVLDIYSPPSLRTVKAGFKIPGGAPYPGLRVTFTSLNGDVVRHGVTDSVGVCLFSLPDGRYRVTVQDTSIPGRVFTRNNFGPYEVVDPTSRASGNEVQWEVEWLDVSSADWVQVPVQYRSVMHMRLMRGPTGVPDSYRRFVVRQTHVWRGGGYVVAPGEYEAYLGLDGSATVSLIRGTYVQIVFPQAGVTVGFEVPDEEEFEFASIHGPDPFTVTTPKRTYPVRVS